MFAWVSKNGDQLSGTDRNTANGAEHAATDRVFPNGDGRFDAVFVAEFNPIMSECTGRFADVVDSSFLMIAVSDPFELTLDENGFTPPFHYTWGGERVARVHEGNESHAIAE